ncbi:MAG: Maf family protein [bacterium]
MILTPFVPWPADLVLLLASASPRRAELLQVAGIPFEVLPAPDAEASEAAVVVSSANDDPARYAQALATAKTEAVWRQKPERLVLGADTVVVHAGEILEKPLDRIEAIRCLTRLAGQSHRVITALCLRAGPIGTVWTGWEQTTVEFLPLSTADIERYCDTGEPYDKAGAYGIQGYGSLMVRRIDGCYFNVMGLPLALLGQALRHVLGENSPVQPGENDASDPE